MYRRRYGRCCCMNNCNEYDNDNIEKKCSNIVSDYEYDDDCECGYDSEYTGFPTNPMLGQSYVPIQQMEDVFIPSVGLKMGTIYPELVNPYMPCQSMKEIEYLRQNNEIGEGCNK